MDKETEILRTLSRIDENTRLLRIDFRDLKINLNNTTQISAKNRMQIALLKRDAKWRTMIIAAVSGVVATIATLATEYFHNS